MIDYTAPSNITTYFTPDILYPNPFIEAWMKWGLAKQYRQQPAMTLIGIVTACGALMGRKWEHQGTRPNIYAGCLSATASGKEQAQRVVREVISTLKYDGQAGVGLQIMGGDDQVSAGGLLLELETCPQRVWFKDEFHSLIERAASMTSLHGRDVINMLLTLYEGGKIQGRSKVGSGKQADIPAPHACYVGYTTPELFWPLISPQLISGGFLGRFLIVCGNPMAELQYDVSTAKPIPAIMDPLLEWVAKDPIKLLELKSPIPPVSRQMPFPDEVRDEEKRISQEVENERKKRHYDAQFRAVAGRDFEKIRRLSMIYAWTENMIEPKLSIAGYRWAYEIAKTSRNMLVQGSMIAGEVEDTEAVSLAMENFIREKSPVNRTQIYYRFRYAFRYDQILNDMVKAGIVEEAYPERKPNQRGRLTAIYTYKGTT